MEDFGMPLAKQWEILFDRLATQNPKTKSKPYFVRFEFHRFEHLTIMVAKLEGFNERTNLCPRTTYLSPSRGIIPTAIRRQTMAVYESENPTLSAIPIKCTPNCVLDTLLPMHIAEVDIRRAATLDN
jgi:hypothetical protein